MSFIYLFETGAFEPEYTYNGPRFTVEVMKVGGGTVGKVYGIGEAWLWRVTSVNRNVRGQYLIQDSTGEYTTGLNPQNHDDVAKEVEECLGEE